MEAIVALPEQFFYSTGISTCVWELTNRKEPHRKGKIQLIDLDATTGKVEIQERDFFSYGSAANWLVSKAFDLSSDTSLEHEAVEEKVLVQEVGPTLSDIDPIWLDLRDFCRAKGASPLGCG